MDMPTQMLRYVADHRLVLEQVAAAAGFAEPVAIDLDEFREPLLAKARRGPVLPLCGVLVRDWDPDFRRGNPGAPFGMRAYEIGGVRFVLVSFDPSSQVRYFLSHLAVVDRKNYRKLYQIALRSRRDHEPPAEPPVLPPQVRQALWDNSIAYLERTNLRKIRSYRGRPRRGLLLTGPPGNGKTSACRWLWQECRRRRWEWRLVTPDAYAQARRADDAEEAVRRLFEVEGKGIVFFDDLDLALRDREMVRETDDQAVFLGALDGIAVKEGVVFVFTTNCPLDLIDPAFKRPGRIDVVLEFPPPDAPMRRQLMERWHADIRREIDWDRAVAATADFSFAELDELRNLLIVLFMSDGRWDLEAALRQLDFNRRNLGCRPRGPVGFAALTQAAANGRH
jgi:hypothetical protein